MSTERSYYIRDITDPKVKITRGLMGQGRVRHADSPENALKRYLNDSYRATRQATRNATLFVPKKSYEVFLLSNPVEIEVTPIIEDPFTLKVTHTWTR